jgi:hypothetical protein
MCDYGVITRQARGLLQMAITAIGRRIARNGRVNAARRTDTGLYEWMVNYVYGNSGRTESPVEETNR